jgi:hypothetical protein
MNIAGALAPPIGMFKHASSRTSKPLKLVISEIMN